MKHTDADFTEDEIELFEQIIPHHEYGIHTIKSVEFRQVQTLKKFSWVLTNLNICVKVKLS